MKAHPNSFRVADSPPKTSSFVSHNALLGRLLSDSKHCVTMGDSVGDLPLAPGAAETRTVSFSVTAEETAQTFRWALAEPSAWIWIQLTSSTHCHDTAVAVHRDVLPGADTLACHAGPQHRGDAVFPRHNGTVTQRAAHIRDDA